MSATLLRLIVSVAAITVYSLMNKEKYRFWKRTMTFYSVFLLVIPIEYYNVYKLQNTATSQITDYFLSYIIITLSICLFIVSCLMNQYEKQRRSKNY